MENPPQTISKLIQKNLTPDLLHKKFRNQKNKYSGYCYVASEAFFHLNGGKIAGFKPKQMNYKGTSHWWIEDSNQKVWDLTAKQFTDKVPYHLGKGRGFLTKNPSRRAYDLMVRVTISLACIAQDNNWLTRCKDSKVPASLHQPSKIP